MFTYSSFQNGNFVILNNPINHSFLEKIMLLVKYFFGINSKDVYLRVKLTEKKAESTYKTKELRNWEVVCSCSSINNKALASLNVYNFFAKSVNTPLIIHMV